MLLPVGGGGGGGGPQKWAYGGGVGVLTPNNGLYGEAPPEKSTLFRLQVYERVEILQVEVYERIGKSVISICEKVQRG